jgi:hypothetical protein
MRHHRVGEYRWVPRTDTWQWDPGMYGLHGYRPGAVTPSRALLLAHKHPATRARATEVLGDAVSDGRDYVCRNRIVAFDGQVRDVLSIGYAALVRSDESGHGSGQRCGYLLDVTGARHGPAADPPSGPLGSAQAVLRAHLPLTPEAALDLLDHVAAARHVAPAAIADSAARLRSRAPADGYRALLDLLRPAG